MTDTIDVVLLGGPLDGATLRTADGQPTLDMDFRPGAFALKVRYHRATQLPSGVWQYVFRYPRKTPANKPAQA